MYPQGEKNDRKMFEIISLFYLLNNMEIKSGKIQNLTYDLNSPAM